METNIIDAEEVEQETVQVVPEFQHDENGNVIYMKDPDGVETWWTRNEKGKVLTVKDSNGYFMERELDENGNCIHMKNSEGLEYWGTVRPDGNPLTYKDNFGFEETYTYTENGKLKRYENNKGEWEEYTFDEAGQVTSVKSDDGFESHNEYDADGNVIRQWTSDGEEQITTKLENGNYLLTHTAATGEHEVFELDSNRNTIRYKNDKVEEFMTRNENGHVINFRTSDGLEVSYEVDEAGNILNETIISGSEETSQGE